MYSLCGTRIGESNKKPKFEVTNFKNKIRLRLTKSEEKRSEIRKSISIDESLRTGFTDYLHRPFSLLIAGPAGSGKSTLLAQMKKVWHENLQKTDTPETRSLVITKTLKSLKNLETYAISCEEKEISTLVKTMIETLEVKSDSQNDDSDVQALWANRNFQLFLCEESEKLSEQDLYFLSRVPDVISPGFQASSEDLFWARSPCKGLFEWRTNLHGVDVSVFDPSMLVGVNEMTGLPHKLVHYFERIDMVVFVVDVSTYDVPAKIPTHWKSILDEYVPADLSNLIIQYGISLEDNLLSATMDEFKSNCDKWFERKLKVVILNKVDVFAKNFSHSTFRVCFPDYDPNNEKGKRSVRTAIRFLRSQFQGLGYHVRSFTSSLSEDKEAKKTLKRIAKPLERINRLEEVLVHVGVL